MNIITKVSLILIVICGFTLRYIGISERPKGLTWDEAALGYNAYSLIKTGKDEWGQSIPVVFKSFGDYKPGLYIYFSVPFVQFFGLSEQSVRSSSALIGSLSIVVLYCFVQKLLTRKTRNFNLGLVASFLLAINPWSIHFSRGAWESNIWVFFTLTSITLYIYNKKALSALFAGLTFWIYQGAKLLTSILVLIGFSIQPKKLLNKSNLYAVIILGIFVVPILIGLPTQSGRLKVYSLFNYTRREETVKSILLADKEETPGIKYYSYHTEKLNQLRGFVQRYMNHFSPRYLFIEGDWTNLRQSTPYHGNFYLFEFATLILGVISLIKYRNKKALIIIGLLMLTAPLGAALSRDIVSGVRSLPLTIPITIISSIGLFEVLKRWRLVPIAFLIIAFSLIYFIDLYFIHAPYYSGSYWMSGIREVMDTVKSEKNNYNKIIFSNKIGQPYIYTLFYENYDPKLYRSTNMSVDNEYGDVGDVVRYGIYEFRPIFWPADRGASNTLFISDEFELPSNDISQTRNAQKIKEVYHPNGSLFLKIVGTQ